PVPRGQCLRQCGHGAAGQGCDRRLPGLYAAGARDPRSVGRAVAGVLLPDRYDLPHRRGRVPRDRGAHRLRRARTRRVEDERIDHHRGLHEGRRLGSDSPSQSAASSAAPVAGSLSPPLPDETTRPHTPEHDRGGADPKICTPSSAVLPLGLQLWAGTSPRRIARRSSRSTWSSSKDRRSSSMSQWERTCLTGSPSGSFIPTRMPIPWIPESQVEGTSASMEKGTLNRVPSSHSNSTIWRGAGSTPSSVSRLREPNCVPRRLRSLISKTFRLDCTLWTQCNTLPLRAIPWADQCRRALRVPSPPDRSRSRRRRGRAANASIPRR